MRLFLIFLLSLLALTGGLAVQVMQSGQNSGLSPEIIQRIADTRRASTDVIETIQQEINTPPPLRGRLDQTAGSLSVAGILNETNKHRAAAGLPPLTANTTLNRAADSKVADMFAQQYFEHVNPDGIGPAQVAERAGYQFLAVGENLALGNFTSDADLVQAWMDSPGHRANILEKNFTEIGLAASRGTFEGQTTWLAVQTFGVPAAACPAPEQTLRDSIAQQQTALEQEQAGLEPLADEVAALSKQGNEKIAAGNEAIKKGNAAAADGNEAEAEQYWQQGQALQQEGEALIAQAEQKRADYNRSADNLQRDGDALNALISKLNGQINTYNSCLQSFTN